jgi:dihydrodipicolinate synthase/N-acetylneuraminate lyase
MHADGRIDDRGTAATVSCLVSEGVAGLVMLGMVGDLVLESMALGAVGSVSGIVNAYPAESVETLDLIARGDWERSAALSHNDARLPLRHQGQAGAVHKARGRDERRRHGSCAQAQIAPRGEERAVLERAIRVTREEFVRYRLSTEPHIKSNIAS